MNLCLRLTCFVAKQDVVLTTYGMLQGEYRRKNPLLLKCEFLRVVLDEAHSIRNQRTLVSKVCCELKARHRWCVTGTIIQNSLDDVFGTMKFLRHEPWCWPAFWKAAITIPSRNDGNDLDVERHRESLNIALDRVRRLLGPIMLRRTKDSKTIDGTPILTLPPVETKVVMVDLSETEREFYNSLLARSLEVFDQFMESKTAATSYIQIFALLQRLRQTCDHIALTVRGKHNNQEWLNATQEESITSDTTSTLVAVKPSSKSSDVLGKDFFDNLLQKFCTKQSLPRDATTKRKTDDKNPAKLPRDGSYMKNVLEDLRQSVLCGSIYYSEECAICLDNPRIVDIVLTPCAHIFCRSCLLDALREKASNVTSTDSSNTKGLHQSIRCPDGVCPTCQETVEAKRIVAFTATNEGNGLTSKFLSDLKPAAQKIQPIVKHDANGTPLGMARQILAEAINGTESSKMKTFMHELNAVWRLDPGSKVLVFSHYLGFLDLLEIQMKQSGIPFYRLDGKLSLQDRKKVLDRFASCTSSQLLTTSSSQQDQHNCTQSGTVLLISMSAGGEGLNIVSASSCFILEPWWNSAREDQCINRIHRIGQKASIVRVRKFVCRNTVEERIVELQRRKAYVASGIYNDDTGVVGSSKMSAASLSLEDFKLLFRSS